MVGKKLTKSNMKIDNGQSKRVFLSLSFIVLCRSQSWACSFALTHCARLYVSGVGGGGVGGGGGGVLKTLTLRL